GLAQFDPLCLEIQLPGGQFKRFFVCQVCLVRGIVLDHGVLQIIDLDQFLFMLIVDRPESLFLLLCKFGGLLDNLAFIFSEVGSFCFDRGIKIGFFRLLVRLHCIFGTCWLRLLGLRPACSCDQDQGEDKDCLSHLFFSFTRCCFRRCQK